MHNYCASSLPCATNSESVLSYYVCRQYALPHLHVARLAVCAAINQYLLLAGPQQQSLLGRQTRRTEGQTDGRRTDE